MSILDQTESIRYQEYANADARSLQSLTVNMGMSCMAEVYDDRTATIWDAYHLHVFGGGPRPSASGRLAERLARDEALYRLTEQGRADIEAGRYSTFEDIQRRFGDV